MGGYRYSFAGTFDGFGFASNMIPRSGTNALKLLMKMDPAGNRRLLGTVGTFGIPSWTADLDVERVGFNAVTNPAPFAGAYTVVFRGSGNAADATKPFGDGYSTAKITTAGKVTLSGVMADGAAFSSSGILSQDGLLALYVPLSTGPAQVLGWLNFNSTPEADVSGDVNWLRLPKVTATTYRAGFNWQTNATGSRLNTTLIPALSFTSGSIVLAGGNLAATLVDPVNFVSNKVSNLGTNALTFTLYPTTGLIKGTMFDPARAKQVSFKGIILQKQNYGTGFFLGTNQSGNFYFGP
jgi:hypothetical protein